MKCINCGAELKDGVLYCRECGSRVPGLGQKRFCRKCGNELNAGDRFCSYCGATVGTIEDQVRNTDKRIKETALTKIELLRNRIDTEAKRIRAPKKPKMPVFDRKKTIIILCGLLVLLLLLLSCSGSSSDKKKKTEGTVPVQPVQQATAVPVETNYTIEKGSEYAFMTDEWNVYIARALSDSIIKIEHWNKSLQTTKTLKYEEDIGSYKINDPSNGFSWLDDSHMAFSFLFQDKNSSHAKSLVPRVFTINISDSDKYKGTDYDKTIRCYSYTNDSWHLYRAIPLTNELMKIECWSRAIANGNACFGWDWCVIDLTNTTTDFKWTDDEHTSFTITTKDPNNSYYWKTESFIVFELENAKYKYETVADYLGMGDTPEPDKEEPVEQAETEKTVAAEASATEAPAPEVTTAPTPTDTPKAEPTPSPAPTSTPSPSPKPTASPTPKPKAASFHSSNNLDTAKKGNSGVFAYSASGKSQELYYIIDFDKGYVYCFSEGDGSNTCERVKIQKGDLNSVLIITYHDSGDVWSYGMHFKWKNQPDHLVIEDNDGFEYDFYSTDLSDALKLRDKRKLYDY